MLTVVAGEGETSRMAAGYRAETQQPSGSYLPRHSPILNLSPNLSPESQPDSSSPVFELLDSNRRRTVQDIYGSLSHLTQDLVNLVNEEEAKSADAPAKKKRKMMVGDGANAMVSRHPTSRPRSHRRHRREGYSSLHNRHSSSAQPNADHPALPQTLYPEPARVPPISGPVLGEAVHRLNGVEANFASNRHDHQTVRQPRPFLIDLSNPSAENASQANAIQWQRMRAAVGGHPAYSSYNPAVISVGGVPCPPILAHSLPVSTQAHRSGVYRPGVDLNVNHGASTRESVMAQLRASIPNPPVLSTHRPHHQQPLTQQHPQAPHPQSGRRHENILPAHQPRLYTGHQSHPYAHHPRVSSEPGASAQRIHEMQCPAAFMNRPTAASLLVPDMSNPQQPTSAAPTLNPLNQLNSHMLRAGGPASGPAAMHPYARHLSQRLANRAMPLQLPIDSDPQLNYVQYPSFIIQLWSMFSNQGAASPYRMDLTDDITEIENYEALLNLAERLGEAKPKGLHKTEIEHLISYKYNPDVKRDSTKDQSSCVVCMCDFEEKQTLRVLPCSHEFHSKCVDKWLKSNRTCPICRSDASQRYQGPVKI